MELRHLRYFVAVAEAGSLTLAAEQRLHTAQPSLSRQIRALEHEVGVPLMRRSVRGVELTAAGRAFLDHARLALTQADAAKQAARRAAQPVKATFALGFLRGTEMDWMAPAMRILHDELPDVDVTVSSQYSPDLAAALMRGRLDAAFMRAEPHAGLAYRRVLTEPFILLFPTDHRLAVLDAIELRDIVDETFIIPSAGTAPVLQTIIEDYLRRSGLEVNPRHEVDNMGHAMSMVAAIRAVGLLPAYARNFLTSSVTSRPFRGDAPEVDLLLGYNEANASPILKRFLLRIDHLAARGSGAPA